MEDTFIPKRSALFFRTSTLTWGVKGERELIPSPHPTHTNTIFHCSPLGSNHMETINVSDTMKSKLISLLVSRANGRHYLLSTVLLGKHVNNAVSNGWQKVQALFWQHKTRVLFTMYVWLHWKVHVFAHCALYTILEVSSVLIWLCLYNWHWIHSERPGVKLICMCMIQRHRSCTAV